MPYDHKNTTPDGLPLKRMKALLEEVNHLHCQERCMIGSGGGSVGSVDFYLNLIWTVANFCKAIVCILCICFLLLTIFVGK